MGLFDSLFEKKALPQQVANAGTISRAISGSVNHTGWENFEATSRWNMTRSMSAYRRVMWVFRAVHAISAAQANLEINLVDTTTQPPKKTQDSDDIYRLLNKKANPHEDAWTFRYRLSSQGLLSPKGAFIEVVRNDNTNRPVELYLLPPDSVTPIPDSKRWISGYRVRTEGRDDILDPENVVWWRPFPDLNDVYKNNTPLESCGISVETDYFARLFNKNYLKNDGRPSMVVAAKGDLDPETADELNYIMNNSGGQTRVIEADGLDFVEIAGKPADAQWSEALEAAKENILTAFGVPESLIGNASGRCLRASEVLHLANGEAKRAEELVGQTFELLQPRTYGMTVVKAKAEYAKQEKIYRIKTYSGRTLETNGEHPLYMAISVGQGQKGVWKKDLFPYGWTPMKDIKSNFDKNDRQRAGSYTEIAVPTLFRQTEEVAGDPNQAKIEGESLQIVPEYLFTADKATQRAFISGLYSKHGKVSQHTGFDLYVPTQGFAESVQRLLLRVGVYSNVVVKKQQHAVEILTKPNMLNFLAQIALTGKAKENADKVQQRLTTNSNFVIHSHRKDGLPPGMMWDRVLEVEEIGEDQTVAIVIQDSTERHYLSLFWEHNTFSNADAELENFWMETMRYHCTSLQKAIEPLSVDTDDNIEFQFDYSTVDILQQAERRKLDRYRQDLNNGVITINDYRKLLGLEKIDLPYANVYWQPRGVIGGTPSDIANVRLLPVIGTGGIGTSAPGDQNPFLTSSTTGGNGTVGGITDQVQGETAAVGANANQTTNDQAARTLRSSRGRALPPEAVNPRASSEIQNRVNTLINKSYNLNNETKAFVQEDPNRDLRSRLQGFVEGSLETWSSRQLNVVGDRLSHSKVRKGTRHWTGEAATKSLDTDYIVEVDEWADEIKSTVRNGLKNVLTRESKIRFNDLSDTGVKVTPLSDVDINSILEQVVSTLDRSVSQQSKLLQQHINVLDTAGKSIDEMKSTLQPESFDRYNWSTLLAKVLTTSVIEMMNFKLFSQVEGEVTKTWKTANTEFGRHNHIELNGKTIGLNEEFAVGSVNMLYPSGKLGTESDSCNCWTFYNVKKLS